MRERRELTSLYLGLACMLIALVAFCTTAQARTGKVHLTDKIKQVPAQSELYKKNIKPLALEQCAQCHIGVFGLLKEQGNRHQKECTFCHEVYHTFAPGKVEYKDAIPVCQDCHGFPHGNKEIVQVCSNCHSNAHSPLNIPDITADMCVNCHSGPPSELQKYPSKHTDVACTDCHTTHGKIPSCFDCHSEDGGEPYHLTGVESSVCLGCHPVHSPLEIQYADDTPQKFCAPCHKNPSHERVLKTVRAADSLHNTEVTCASCHDVHGKIPDCSQCHDNDGHREGLATQDCLRCHTNPHEPMNITFSQTEPKESCKGCHTEVYDELIASNTRHTKQTCTLCHPKHGEIPQCQKCHGVPHGDVMLQQFDGKCGGCHGIAHNVQGRMKK